MRPHSTIWRKAAVLGGLWGSLEIVVGSFLHNAQFPLSGHVLTAVAVALLVAGRRLWPEPGLLWRAGVVCAAMKSISPSPFLLSPMIAIAIEGCLLELGTAAGGAPGLLLGGGLAMSWNLFHKSARLLLFYGPSAAAVYLRGLKSVLPTVSPWTPLLVLAAAHFAGGCAAAAVGLLVRPAEGFAPECRAATAPRASVKATALSPIALALHLPIVAALVVVSESLPWPGLVALSGGYVAACVLLYPGAARRLAKPGFWLGLLAFCALAGFLLGRPALGAAMAIRAVTLTVGFTAIAIELRHPALRRTLERFGAAAYFSALDAAFETLPWTLSAIPEGRRFLRHPFEALGETLALAPLWLERLERRRAEIHIVTGEKGAGKSSLVADVAKRLREQGKIVGGIHAPGFWTNGRRSGFDVVDLHSGRSLPLCRADGPVEWTRQGSFRFSPDGMRFGRQALARARERNPDVIVVDEIGPLELQGDGWAAEIDRLAAECDRPMLWVVRPSAIDEVRRRWGVDATVWNAPGADAGALVRRLVS